MLGIQLAVMIVFNIVELRRDALVQDDATYYQGFYLISHGHLNPIATTVGFPYLRVNGELITYPLAFLLRPILSQTSFLIFEDLCLVAAGAVGLIWLLEVVRRPTWPARLPPWIAVSTYVLLVAINPWLYQTIAYPWHFEPFDVLVVMLAAYFLEHRQWKRAAVFVFLGLLSGATGIIMVVGLGIGTVLAGRRWRRAGLIVAMSGVAMLLVMSSVGLTATSAGFAHLFTNNSVQSLTTHISVVGILKDAVEHPGKPLKFLWGDRLNIYANLGPSGIIGIFSPWGFGAPFTSLSVSELAANETVHVPQYQNAAVYVFVTLGTVFVLRRIALVRRIPRALPLGLTGLVAANAVLWAVVWLPQIPRSWIRVSPAAAAVLRRAADTIPQNAQVISSVGVVGAFAQRPWVSELGALTYGVVDRTVYFIVAPNQGIEDPNVADALSAMAYIADDLHATLVDHGGGVWVFRWNPPKGITSFHVGENPHSIPAWTVPGPAGTSVLAGNPTDWISASSGRKGYVVSGDYWRRGLGRYRANVTLSANIPVNIEVWNETSNTLLARRDITATNGLQNVSFGVDVTKLAGPQADTVSGSALFKIDPVQPTPGNSFEIRVWSPEGGGVSVYRLGLRRVGR